MPNLNILCWRDKPRVPLRWGVLLLGLRSQAGTGARQQQRVRTGLTDVERDAQQVLPESGEDFRIPGGEDVARPAGEVGGGRLRGWR